MGLGIYLFSRLENWLDAFALISATPLEPVAPVRQDREAPLGSLLARRDIVLVPKLSHAPLLEMHLARHHGVSAGTEFDLPGRFLWQLITESFEEVQDQAPFQAERLRWTVFDILDKGPLPDGNSAVPGDLPAGLAQRVLSLKTFADGRDASQLPLFDLACRLAAVFEGYVINREDWLQHWAAGRSVPDAGTGNGSAKGLRHVGQFRAHENWQAWLWREILRHQKALAKEHPFARFERDIAVVAARARSLGIARITLMGMPALTWQQMRLFALLGQHLEVRWLAMNPCKAFWDDLPALARHEPQAFLPETPWLNQQGPALLGLWGKGQRDFLAMLQALESAPELSVHLATIDVPTAQPTAGVLGALQEAIESRSAFAASEAAAQEYAAELADDGAGIQVHACQTLSHQLLVLRQCLVRRFDDAARPLRPSDCVVLCADLEAARPAIEQIFGNSDVGGVRTGQIAFRIARSERPGSALADLVLDMLAYQPRQFSLEQLTQWLTQPLFLALVRLDADQAARWVAQLAAAGFVSNLGERHGFEAALERLLMAAAIDRHAVPADLGLNVHGRRAMLSLSLQEVNTLEPLLALIGAIEAFAQGTRTLPGWVSHIDAWLCQWIEPLQGLEGQSALGQDLQSLRFALQQALRSYPVAQGDRNGDSPASGLAVDAPVLRRCLSEAMQQQGAQSQLGGTLNFLQLGAGLVPPTPVVAVLGLDANVWPRQVTHDELDLSRAWTRQGDLSGYFQDRAHVLDALLAAREAFWMFYQGIDPASGKTLGPSSQVSELLASLQIKARVHAQAIPFALQRPLRLGEDESFALVRHHLAGLTPEVVATPGLRPLRLRTLLDALLDPSRALLRHWSLSLQREQVLAAQEPLDVSTLDEEGGYSLGRLGQSLARQHLLCNGSGAASAIGASAFNELTDHPALADGPGSARMAERINEAARSLLDNVSRQMGELAGKLRPQSLRLRVPGYELQEAPLIVWSGELPVCQLVLGRSTITINALLHCWLMHCLCNALLGPLTSRLIAIKGALSFAAFDTPQQALAMLEAWIAFYQSGLSDPHLFTAEAWAGRELLPKKKAKASPPAAESSADGPEGEEAVGDFDEAGDTAALSESALLVWKEAWPELAIMEQRAGELVAAIKRSLEAGRG